MNLIDLRDRQAVITGAAKGIGYAIAQKMLASGAKVAIWDLDAQAGHAAAGKLAPLGQTGFFQLDVTDPDSVARAAEQTAARFGPVDILVNNAGILGPTTPTLEYGFKDWQTVFSVNLNRAFFRSPCE